MIKLYPDRRWPAFLRVLSDTITVGWTIVWAYLGWLIYQTIMGLEVIADAITNTGTTFNGWIASFRNAVPGGIPLLTKFLLDVADTLRKYSGDSLVSTGHQIHDAVFQLAIVLALLVALPPILLVMVPYAAWRWRERNIAFSQHSTTCRVVDLAKADQPSTFLEHRPARLLANTTARESLRSSESAALTG